MDEEETAENGRSGSVGSVGSVTPGVSQPKPRWYLLVALLVDAIGLGPAMWGILTARQPEPLAAAVAAGVVWMLVRACRQRYGARSLGESGEALAVPRDWMIAVGILAVARALTGERSDPLLALASLVPGMVCTMITARMTYRHLRTTRRSLGGSQRALVVGEPSLVDYMVSCLSRDPACRYTVVGAVPIGEAPVDSDTPVLARLPSERSSAQNDVPRVLIAAASERVDLVLVAPGAQLLGDRLDRFVWGLQDAAMPVAALAGPADVLLRRFDLQREAGINLMHAKAPMRGVQAMVKAALDRCLAAAGLLLLAPLLLALAALVASTSPGPVLFRQRRVGLGGKSFTMFKFRTMVHGAEALQRALADFNVHPDGVLFKMRRDPRITRAGGFLRRYSLDDLPQLVNVLRGDMSLVGPRPLLPQEISTLNHLEEAWSARRLLIRPGMTGLTRANGDSDLSWEAAVKLDMQYIETWSLGLDLGILARAMTVIVRGRGY
ncbi:exopolysaccharide biosynthesis polyprenyl glycosylphosphotransferase [Streptomyces sp. NPDC059443]|uniref:exopolysaccharide biosynthesis polyprenyl glycosylphosphotransferase n=1 Tax=unclassified Streptomyces TaxID=2593676 RepID=UPI0036763F2E